MPTEPPIEIEASFPPKLAGLFSPYRYKIIYGGRGGAKSWSIARALLLMAHERPLRVLCAREYMQSIQDSVWRLLVDQIHELGLGAFYHIERASIKGMNGSEFRFAGIRSNISQIKSFEGIDVAWCEEADNVSKESYDVLIPTIRAPDSEIWISFNPSVEESETYNRFVINTPPDSLVVKVSYKDNPWFPEPLRKEMESLKERNFDDYMHVYEGECRRYYDGAVYTDELRQAEDEGRITTVRYDPAAGPVTAVFDLGFADATAIWILQKSSMETRCIKYLENQQKPIDYYLKALTDLPYGIDRIVLPHDARAKSLGSGKSISELIRQKGYSVTVCPNLSLADGINAVRTVMPSIWFDRRSCADGLKCLRNYRYEVAPVEIGGLKKEPVHDRWSHGADALRYACIALRAPKVKGTGPKYVPKPKHQTSWMGR